LSPTGRPRPAARSPSSGSRLHELLQVGFGQGGKAALGARHALGRRQAVVDGAQLDDVAVEQQQRLDGRRRGPGLARNAMPRPELELLAPARDADIGIEAINHGADAVYIGGPSFGARDKAGNEIADIERLVQPRAPLPRASSSRSTPSCATTNWRTRAGWPGTCTTPVSTR
jgi:hypothetical protein